MKLERKSGILLHPSSFPGKFGIGTIGYEAFEFVDFLSECGIKLWQICPLGPTGFGDSPYQCFSAFAGNPLLIDLDDLVKKGFLLEKDLDAGTSFDDNNVDFGKVISYKYPLLKKAADRFFSKKNLSPDSEYSIFCDKESFWLDDYSLFMALKNYYSGVSWSAWQKKYKIRDNDEINKFRDEHKGEISFQKFMQFIFNMQWNELKRYSNKKNVLIIGDMPLFVAFDSADSWAHPEYFYFNSSLEPQKVAGVPPDYFSSTGQLWGNPLYNWKKLKALKYEWWVNRLKMTFEMYDLVRLDHFRGFAEYWAIPFGEKTAVYGKWEKGPGHDFFETVIQSMGELPIIAEDLGYITPDVIRLRDDFGIPGMSVLQFAFDSGPENHYLPHNFLSNTVVYTGNHDNNTIRGWHENLNQEIRSFLNDYIDFHGEDINWSLIRLAWSSNAAYAVTTLQDLLGLGSEGRMNIPGTSSGNWRWRFKKGAIKGEIKAKLQHLNYLYGR